MTRMWKFVLGFGALALAATAASAAYAQVATAGDQAKPKGFNWEIKDGKRVPKGQKQVNADGSSRGEIRQRKCVTIKEKSRPGEYNESRKCD